MIFVGDIVEKNGKTIKENNLEERHNIPIGSLVEVKYNKWYGEGACAKIHARLWVVEHNRDCDGTPLYTLSGPFKDGLLANRFHQADGGFSEESLTKIEVTDDLKHGHGSLRWEE